MPTQPSRNLALDRFRGLAILLMVLVNGLEEAPIPAFFKHAPDVGYTLADVVAPLFIFAIALTYRQSFLKHIQTDKKNTYLRFLRRYLAFIGMGAVFSAVEAFAHPGANWGVMQAIGVAGLMTLLVIRFSAPVRAVIACALLVGYQLLLNFFLLDTVLASPHGGIFGALSWGAMLILCTIVTEFVGSPKQFAISFSMLVLFAGASLFLVPISKNRVSLSYVLASTAISCAVYYAVVLLSKVLPKKADLTVWWGENSLLMYFLHLVFIGASRVPFILLNREENQPLALALGIELVILAALSIIARTLHKKRILLSL